MIVSLAAFILTSLAAADELPRADEQQEQRQRQQERERLLAKMRELAKQTQLRFQQGDRQPQLVESPVFRYDDQPRHFLDATLWTWTDQGRPVAFQKVEAMESRPLTWQYCFTSVSEELLDVQWAGKGRFQSTSPGIEFRRLTDAPAVAAGSAQRKRQARELAREFSARIVIDPVNNRTDAMRFLPTPIFEYAEAPTTMFRGAVFGLTTNGTNPDLLLLLEARREDGGLHWNYAAARMTTGGLTLRYREVPVWEAEFVAPRSTHFPTWTFFSVPDGETAGDESARGRDRAILSEAN
ncbi:MAG TPA: hypothetical protein VG826_19470 [Pirellulales bacterium]|nr:hypothetical protein [Pirellulales bacterium]